MYNCSYAIKEKLKTAVSFSWHSSFFCLVLYLSGCMEEELSFCFESACFGLVGRR